MQHKFKKNAEQMVQQFQKSGEQPDFWFEFGGRMVPAKKLAHLKSPMAVAAPKSRARALQAMSPVELLMSLVAQDIAKCEMLTSNEISIIETDDGLVLARKPA